MCRAGVLLARHRASSTPGDDPAHLVGVERAQVADALADADRVDRQAEFLRRRDQHAAARGAVQLGHHQPGDAGDLLEHLDLVERVLPRRRVEHEHHVVRRGRVDPPEHAADLGELVHQLALVLEPAGGVDDQHVGADLGRLLDRVPDDPGRVAALGAGDDRHADALGPGRELPDRGGAERVARRQHDADNPARSAGAPAWRSWSSCPMPLTPMTRITCGRGNASISSGLRDLGERALDLLGDDQADAQLLHVALEAAFGQPRADARRGLGAEIGRDQRLLDLVERRLVEPRRAEPGEVADQPVGGARNPPRSLSCQEGAGRSCGVPMSMGRGGDARDDAVTPV